MKKDPIANSTKFSVTFEAAAEIQAESLALVGEFNDWDVTAALMKRRKDGTWAKTLRLETGTYSYRFLADGQVWHNDPTADSYQPSGLGEDNSVVVVGG
jgi:1,4-alpha-glucan branching enzyme